MTIKKSLISTAAAALLVAGMTGCSSSDSDSTPPAPSGQPTSLTAADGYILNSKVTIRYNEGNATNPDLKNIVVDNTALESIINGEAGTGKIEIKTNSATSEEINSTVIDNIVSISLAQKAAEALDDGTRAATYINTDSNMSFTAGKDQLVGGSFSLSTPKGYSVISPITTLIQSAVASQVTTDGNESNRTAIIEDIEAKIADALGLDKADIKDVDPVANRESKQEYAAINAMLGSFNEDATEMEAVAKELKEATKAKNISEAFTNLADSTVDADAKEIFKQIAIAVKTADGKDALFASNLDKTREASADNGAYTVIAQEDGTADFNVTGLYYKTTKVATLATKGAKFDNSLENVVLELKGAKDANVSNKSVAFAVSLSDTRAFELEDKNASNFTLYVPFDFNTTKGDGLEGVLKPVKYDVFNTDDQSVKSGTIDLNSTADWDAFNDAITFGVDGNITLDIPAMITAVEDNTTVKTTFKADSKIAKLKVALVDDNSVFRKTTSLNDEDVTVIWNTSMSVTGLAGYINVKGKQIIDHTTADFREAGLIEVNKAPDNVVTFTGGVEDVNNTNTDSSKLDRFVVNTDTNLSVAVAAQTVNSKEENTTIAFTLPSTYMTAETNLTNVSKIVKSDGVAAAQSDAIHVKDVSSITTKGDLNTSIVMKTTDEFGESNETTLYVVVNRAPTKIDVNSSWADQTKDINITGVGITGNNGTEDNITVANYSGSESNSTGTGGSDTQVLLYDLFTMTDLDNNSTFSDLNVSAMVCQRGAAITTATVNGVIDTNLSFAITPNVNKIGFGATNPGDVIYANECNVTLKAFDQYGLSVESNITISIPADINVSDQ